VLVDEYVSGEIPGSAAYQKPQFKRRKPSRFSDGPFITKRAPFLAPVKLLPMLVLLLCLNESRARLPRCNPPYSIMAFEACAHTGDVITMYSNHTFCALSPVSCSVFSSFCSPIDWCFHCWH
jgi:hypothetical protein